jgi:tryptophan synthase alpha chain
MRLLGARVIPVEEGSKTLRDAINKAFRDWVANADDTYYCFGTVAGAHPFPTMVRDFQRIIGVEARAQILEQAGRLPDAVAACVGGDSNAMEVFHAFLEDSARLVGFEAAGDGVGTVRHAATLTQGSPGAFYSCLSYLLQDDDGQTIESHAIAAALNYPGVGPEHAWLNEAGRAECRPITVAAAMGAFAQSCRLEDIIPAFESAHGLAGALSLGVELGPGRSDPGQSVRSRRQGRRNGRQVVRPDRSRGTELLSMEQHQIIRLGTLFESCRGEGRSALVGYLPTGYPDVRGSIEAMIELVRSGCDLIEVGVADPDPAMDGPTIATATRSALCGGVRVRDTMAAGEAITKAGGHAVVMTYCNPVLRHGVDAYPYARDSAAAGGMGLIVPDLIPDEAGAWLAASEQHQLDHIVVVAPSSTPQRLALTAETCRGFVYAASIMGVTGARNAVSGAVADLVRRVNAVSDIPFGVGLGVRSSEPSAQIASYADGVIAGSALVSTLTDGLPAVRRLAEEMAGGVRQRTLPG